MASSQTPQEVRCIPERTVAVALLVEFAKSGRVSFSLQGYYDEDLELLRKVAERLRVNASQPLLRKLRRVTRKIVNWGVLSAQMRSTHKEFIGEPSKRMEYYFVDPGKIRLLTRGASEHTGTPEWEAGFLLRNVYPLREH